MRSDGSGRVARCSSRCARRRRGSRLRSLRVARFRAMPDECVRLAKPRIAHRDRISCRGSGMVIGMHADAGAPEEDQRDRAPRAMRADRAAGDRVDLALQALAAADRAARRDDVREVPLGVGRDRPRNLLEGRQVRTRRLRGPLAELRAADVHLPAKDIGERPFQEVGPVDELAYGGSTLAIRLTLCASFWSAKRVALTPGTLSVARRSPAVSRRSLSRSLAPYCYGPTAFQRIRVSVERPVLSARGARHATRPRMVTWTPSWPFVGASSPEPSAPSSRAVCAGGARGSPDRPPGHTPTTRSRDEENEYESLCCARVRASWSRCSHGAEVAGFSAGAPRLEGRLRLYI